MWVGGASSTLVKTFGSSTLCLDGVGGSRGGQVPVKAPDQKVLLQPRSRPPSTVSSQKVSVGSGKLKILFVATESGPRLNVLAHFCRPTRLFVVDLCPSGQGPHATPGREGPRTVSGLDPGGRVPGCHTRSRRGSFGINWKTVTRNQSPVRGSLPYVFSCP